MLFWITSVAGTISACALSNEDTRNPEVGRLSQSLEQVVFLDDFSAGLSQWTETGEGDWNTESLVSSSGYPSTSSGAPAAHSDNCDTSCTITMANAVDLSSAACARLEFLRFVSSGLDAGEYLEVQLWNGSSWVREGYWTNGNGDDSRWHQVTVDLTQYLGIDTFKVRFITFENYSTEHVHVDDVRIVVDTDCPVAGFYDDFTNLSQWQESGEGDWNVESLHASTDYPATASGSPAAHADNCVTGCTLTLSNSIDLSQAQSATLSFLRFVDSSLDAASLSSPEEFLKIELFNGSVWNTAFYWKNGAGDDDRWHQETYDLSAYLGTSDFNIRISTLSNSRYEHVHIDDLKVVQGDSPTDLQEQVQTIVDDVRSEAGLPALAAGVVFGNTDTATAVSGIVRIDHPDRTVDIDDSFIIGSCTKSMTATLIGMLVRDGLLDWNSTILDILSPEDEHIVAGSSFTQVTIEEILSHTAGFIRDLSINLGENATALEILEVLLNSTRIATDGSYNYSNTGYMVAGALAEYVTGIPYENLLQDRIFTPLNMTTAGFGWPDADYENDGSYFWYPKNPWGHENIEQIVDPENLKWLHPAWYPAGSVKSSIGDFLKYVNWHLQGHMGNDGLLGLPKEFFEKLHTGIVDTGINPDVPELGPGSYALGWTIHIHPDPNVGVIYTHSGDVGGFNSLMVFSPLKNVALTTIANINGSFSDLVTTTERINALR